jgi:hypothetical protein
LDEDINSFPFLNDYSIFWLIIYKKTLFDLRLYKPKASIYQFKTQNPNIDPTLNNDHNKNSNIKRDEISIG